MYSFDLINDDQAENKVEEVRQIALPLPSEKPGNIRSCLSKIQLSNLLNRNRRASISRPYFHYLRPTRDSARYSTKNSLAFSPRLGKRAIEDEDELENIEKRFLYQSNDLETFFSTLIGYLQEEKIDIVYEDSTKVCLSKPISTAIVQEILDKFMANRRFQNEQDKEDSHQRPAAGKHPVLFRYRLG